MNGTLRTLLPYVQIAGGVAALVGLFVLPALGVAALVGLALVLRRRRRLPRPSR